MPHPDREKTYMRPATAKDRREHLVSEYPWARVVMSRVEEMVGLKGDRTIFIPTILKSLYNPANTRDAVEQVYADEQIPIDIVGGIDTQKRPGYISYVVSEETSKRLRKKSILPDSYNLRTASDLTNENGLDQSVGIDELYILKTYARQLSTVFSRGNTN